MSSRSSTISRLTSSSLMEHSVQGLREQQLQLQKQIDQLHQSVASSRASSRTSSSTMPPPPNIYSDTSSRVSDTPTKSSKTSILSAIKSLLSSNKKEPELKTMQPINNGSRVGKLNGIYARADNDDDAFSVCSCATSASREPRACSNVKCARHIGLARIKSFDDTSCHSDHTVTDRHSTHGGSDTSCVKSHHSSHSKNSRQLVLYSTDSSRSSGPSSRSTSSSGRALCQRFKQCDSDDNDSDDEYDASPSNEKSMNARFYCDRKADIAMQHETIITPGKKHYITRVAMRLY